MKQYVLTLGLAAAALCAVPSNACAQAAPAAEQAPRHEASHRMSPKARLEFLTEKLGLDANQQAQIKAIFTKYHPQIKALMTKGRKNLSDADKTAVRGLKKARAAEIRAVLTPAQQEKLKELRRKDGHGRKHVGHKAVVQ